MNFSASHLSNQCFNLVYFGSRNSSSITVTFRENSPYSQHTDYLTVYISTTKNTLTFNSQTNGYLVNHELNCPGT
jgi:hypothetical protein